MFLLNKDKIFKLPPYISYESLYTIYTVYAG